MTWVRYNRHGSFHFVKGRDKSEAEAKAWSMACKVESGFAHGVMK